MTTQALELFRSAPRYLTARAVGDKVPGLLSGPLAPVRFINRRDAEPLGPGWARVRPILSGICGACWKEWEGVEVKVINEYRLSFLDPQHREMLQQACADFLKLAAG